MAAKRTTAASRCHPRAWCASRCRGAVHRAAGGRSATVGPRPPGVGGVKPKKPIELGDLETAVLRTLWQDAENNTGWFRHGVRGWRHPGEVAYLVKCPAAAETIVALKRADLLTVTTIQVGRRQFLYRLSSAGAQQVAPGQPFVRPRADPGRETYFLRQHDWEVLLAYRAAAADRRVPRRWRTRGWLRADELRTRVYQYGGTGYATATLARIGLVDQRRSRGDATLYSCVSAAGLRLRVVDRQWVGEPMMDEIEVGDLGCLHGIPVLGD